jgi:hypothetical protein
MTTSISVTAETVRFHTLEHNKLWDSSLASTAKKVAMLIRNLFVEAYKYVYNACVHVLNAAYTKLYVHVKTEVQVEAPKPAEQIAESVAVDEAAEDAELDAIDEILEGQPIVQAEPTHMSAAAKIAISTATFAALAAIGGITYFHKWGEIGSFLHMTPKQHQ